MIQDKTLKSKAIQFKGKDYVQVKDRIAYFNEVYPSGSIETVLLSLPDAETVVFKAIIKPEQNLNRIFVGHSQAKWGQGYINQTSALENAETSSVGRALAMMGIGVIDSVASIDEVKKAIVQNPQPDNDPEWVKKESEAEEALATVSRKCSTHNIPLLRALSKTKLTNDGQPKPYWYHINGTNMCFGNET